MYRAIFSGILLSVFFPCLAGKIGQEPSQLVMQGGIGMQIDVENVQQNVPFNTFVNWIGNVSYETGEIFNGTLALALISENGEIKEFIHKESDVLLNPGWGFGQDHVFFNKMVTTDISETDIIRFITCRKDDDIWLAVTSSECPVTYCKVKNNVVVKSKIDINVIGNNEISCEGHCWGTYGATYQDAPIYSSAYELAIKWPEGKNHHFVKVEPDLDRVQLEPERILFQCISKENYKITLMACSDDELITEQRCFVVNTPGTLSQLLTDYNERLYLNSISVSGIINKYDIDFMRDEMPMLEHIDLSNAKITNGILPDFAFDSKPIKTLKLPKNLTGLGTNSLSHTKLTQIDIPESVGYYGLNAFNYSEDLSIIVLRNPRVIPVSWCVLEGTNRSNGVLFVPKGTREAFASDDQWGQFGIIVEGDNVDDRVYESDGTYMYSGVYPNVIITEVINPTEKMAVPESVILKGRTFNVSGIGEQVFSSPQIKELFISKNIISLGNYAIGGNNLEKIEVDTDNPVYFSDEGVLYDRNTSTLLRYPEAKKELEYTVPEGIINIGGWSCYSYCLQKITFPSTLKEIGTYAFRYCGLNYIVSRAMNPPRLGSGAFSSSTYGQATVYVPTNSIDVYKSDVQWKEFLDIRCSEESGVGNIEVDDDEIVVIGNTINVNTRYPINVYDLSGRLIYSGKDKSVELPSGIYILRINGKVKKILI